MNLYNLENQEIFVASVQQGRIIVMTLLLVLQSSRMNTQNL